jgi:hypothetical protein
VTIEVEGIGSWRIGIEAERAVPTKNDHSDDPILPLPRRLAARLPPAVLLPSATRLGFLSNHWILPLPTAPPLTETRAGRRTGRRHGRRLWLRGKLCSPPRRNKLPAPPTAPAVPRRVFFIAGQRYICWLLLP